MHAWMPLRPLLKVPLEAIFTFLELSGLNHRDATTTDGANCTIGVEWLTFSLSSTVTKILRFILTLRISTYSNQNILCSCSLSNKILRYKLQSYTNIIMSKNTIFVLMYHSHKHLDLICRAVILPVPSVVFKLCLMVLPQLSKYLIVTLFFAFFMSK
jgi:hypothetical protein